MRTMPMTLPPDRQTEMDRAVRHARIAAQYFSALVGERVPIEAAISMANTYVALVMQHEKTQPMMTFEADA